MIDNVNWLDVAGALMVAGLFCLGIGAFLAWWFDSGGAYRTAVKIERTKERTKERTERTKERTK